MQLGAFDENPLLQICVLNPLTQEWHFVFWHGLYLISTCVVFDCFISHLYELKEQLIRSLLAGCYVILVDPMDITLIEILDEAALVDLNADSWFRRLLLRTTYEYEHLVDHLDVEIQLENQMSKLSFGDKKWYSGALSGLLVVWLLEELRALLWLLDLIWSRYRYHWRPRHLLNVLVVIEFLSRLKVKGWRAWTAVFFSHALDEIQMALADFSQCCLRQFPLLCAQLPTLRAITSLNISDKLGELA